MYRCSHSIEGYSTQTKLMENIQADDSVPNLAPICVDVYLYITIWLVIYYFGCTYRKNIHSSTAGSTALFKLCMFFLIIFCSDRKLWL